jgi:hypothetical protein
MPTVTTCKSCGKKLRIPDGMSATKARCPGCGAVISLVKTAITAEPPTSLPEEDESPRSQPDRKRRISDESDDDERPRSKLDRKRHIQDEPEEDEKPRSKLDRKRRVQDEPDDDEPRPRKRRVQDEPDDDEPRPRKKKRKRRKKRTSGSEVPLWVWGALAGIVLLFVGLTSFVLVYNGHGPLVLGLAIGMAIMLPVSIVILVISMFISSALVGGIDFGEAHVVVPKAGALLLVVNFIQLIPCIGPFLAIPVWYLGLMGLFELDFMEARVLVAVNWGLNTLFKYLALAAILSAIMHGGMGDGPRKVRVPKEEAPAVKQIEALGGHCDSGDEEGDHIVEVSLENAAIDDTALAPLHSFPKLRVLSLANTRVTDQGLRDVATLSSLERLDLSGAQGVTDVGLGHLSALPKLQSLRLVGTPVTDDGVQKLRAARPGLEVIRQEMDE